MTFPSREAFAGLLDDDFTPAIGAPRSSAWASAYILLIEFIAVIFLPHENKAVRRLPVH